MADWHLEQMAMVEDCEYCSGDYGEHEPDCITLIKYKN